MRYSKLKQKIKLYREYLRSLSEAIGYELIQTKEDKELVHKTMYMYIFKPEAGIHWQYIYTYNKKDIIGFCIYCRLGNLLAIEQFYIKKEYRNHLNGELFINRLIAESPSLVIELNAFKENYPAINFWFKIMHKNRYRLTYAETDKTETDVKFLQFQRKG